MSLKTNEFKIDFGGKELILETGRLAQQANGSVLATYGGTTVLATCAMSRTAKDVNYMPLSVNYEEKLYAAGKIKGSRFIKREGKASDEAILTGRMIDRCLRPVFDSRIRNDIQIVLTVLSFDKKNDPDIPGLIAASAALLISNIPWDGPVAGARVGRINNQWVLNPTYEEREQSDVDVIVAGKDDTINMLEIGAKETNEADILSAVGFGQSHLKQLINFQKEIAKTIKPKKAVLEIKEPDSDLEKTVKDFLNDKLEKVVYNPDRMIRVAGLNELRDKLVEAIGSSFSEKKEEEIRGLKEQAIELFEKELDLLVHKNILEADKRPDNRKLDEVRSLSCDVGVLAQTHGSGLFNRGTTQALSIVTLGSPGDEQIIDGMEVDEKRRFFHHYNFPPFSVGETGPMRGPGRREIGHGALAERALLPLIPSKEEFPYTIRVVSEILSSNGSSSMASVSGSSLALMDAGVPIKEAVSGIAMGLMMESEKKYKILTDIQGPEDHHGDMDCKIAGTKNGVTACQMDVKINGINLEILEKVLEQAKKARLEIIQAMDKAISRPRQELSSLAPRILTLKINPGKIGMVIGPQGKTINKIIDETGANIDIEDDGTVYITSTDQAGGEKALSLVEGLTREAKPGEVYEGKVVKILDFGAFVEILPGQDGMVHISEIAPHRVEKVEDVLKIGQIVKVRVKNIDEQGRINLTMKEFFEKG